MPGKHAVVLGEGRNGVKRPHSKCPVEMANKILVNIFYEFGLALALAAIQKNPKTRVRGRARGSRAVP